jgi:hypothetical protein
MSSLLVSKPIRFSQHVRERMVLRGADEDEVIQTIRAGQWQPAREGKLQARLGFAFGAASPTNQKVYANKLIHVIFADDPEEIVVVTVLVYYEGEITP